MKIINDDGKLKMSGPWAIAFGRDGVWAVTDCCVGCVCIFDGQDELVRKFGSYGRDSGQFANPHGIVFDANNDLYVSEFDSHRIQIQYQCCSSITREQGMVNFFIVVVSQYTMRDYNYVAECNRISVFQLNGQFYCIIGSGQLEHAWDVTVSSNGNLLVANCQSIFRNLLLL